VVFSGLSSTNKTDHKDVIEILLKVALNTINPNPTKSKTFIKGKVSDGKVDMYKCMSLSTYFDEKKGNNSFKKGFIKILKRSVILHIIKCTCMVISFKGIPFKM
jgi:hypothetical protein